MKNITEETDKNAPDQSGQGLNPPQPPTPVAPSTSNEPVVAEVAAMGENLKKKGSNDIQDTVKASGLTLALISALTTRYSATWMLYQPGDQVRNETRQFDEFGSYQLKIGNPNL